MMSIVNWRLRMAADERGAELPGIADGTAIAVPGHPGRKRRAFGTDRNGNSPNSPAGSGPVRCILGEHGHGIGVGHTALAYHLGVPAFAEECVVARTTGEFSGPTRQFDGGTVPPSGR